MFICYWLTNIEYTFIHCILVTFLADMTQVPSFFGFAFAVEIERVARALGAEKAVRVRKVVRVMKVLTLENVTKVVKAVMMVMMVIMVKV
jgi:hypothetical protein